MNFKKFNDIGNSEPRAWNRSSSVGTRIGTADEEDDEVPAPYCDEFDEDTAEEDTEEEDTEEEMEDPEVETETESISSVGSKKNVSKRNKKALAIQQQQISTIILQEEFDFMQE